MTRNLSGQTHPTLHPGRNLGMAIMANGTYLDRQQIFNLVVSLDWNSKFSGEPVLLKR